MSFTKVSNPEMPVLPVANIDAEPVINNESRLLASELYERVQRPTDEILSEVIYKYVTATGKENRLNFGEINETLYKIINFDSCLIGDINVQKFNELSLETKADAFNNYNRSEIIAPRDIQSGWYTFQSWHLTGGEKMNSHNIAHRFYVGVKNESLHDFALELYRSYKDSGAPFYFKIPDNDGVEGRKDNLVIYTTTDLLDRTLLVLSGLANSRSDLVEQCGKPSVLVGNVDNWLGYANEFIDGDKSYTSTMCDCIASGIKGAVEDWIENNPTFLINDQGVEIEIKNYFGKEAIVEWSELQGRLQKILCLLPKIDITFRGNVLGEIKKRLGDYNVDLDNIYFNKPVEEQMCADVLMQI